MTGTVLFVDDEQNILKALQRLFSDTGLRIRTASDAAEAMNILKEEPVSVIVSDNRMPLVSGIEFLEKAKALSPGSLRILLTGYADLHAAIDAINRGEVYRFVEKPWQDDKLVSVVCGAVEKYNLASSLKDADEPKMLALAQTIELKDPYTKGHCERVATYAVRIGMRMELDDLQLKHIRYASWLHDCGKIGVPEEILNSTGRLLPEQMDIIKKHSRWGADVARLAQLPEPVVCAILYHHERFDGTGYPVGLSGAGIPVEARILCIADFYDALDSDRPYRKRLQRDEIMKIMNDANGIFFDPSIFGIFIGELSDV